MGRQILDLTGRRFGMLTALRRDGSGPDHCAMWVCVCDCGNIRMATSRQLTYGKAHSCKDCAREWQRLNHHRGGYHRKLQPGKPHQAKELKPLPAERACKFNNGIRCLLCPKPCLRCGWNPQVADGRRLESCLKTRI